MARSNAKTVAKTYAAPLAIVLGLVVASAGVLFQSGGKLPAATFAHSMDGLSIALPLTALGDSGASGPMAPDDVMRPASWYGKNWQGRTPAEILARAMDGLFTAMPFTKSVDPEKSGRASRDGMTGIASWYGMHWQGRKTASGKRFNVSKLTAAHRSLPLNTRVRVTNTENGKSVVVLINDRGPYVRGRVIDLSTAAARELGMVKEGIVPVHIDIVSEPEAPTKFDTEASGVPATTPHEKSPANLLAGLSSSVRADQTE